MFCPLPAPAPDLFAATIFPSPLVWGGVTVLLGLISVGVVGSLRSLAPSYKHIEPKQKRTALCLIMMSLTGVIYGSIFLLGASWLWQLALVAWLPKQQCLLREPRVFATYQQLEGHAHQLTNVAIWLGLIGAVCFIFCTRMVRKLGWASTHERIIPRVIDVPEQQYPGQPYGQLSMPPTPGNYPQSPYLDQPPAQYPPQ